MRRVLAALLLATLIVLGAPSGASTTTSTTWPPIGGAEGDVVESTRVADAVRLAAVGAVGLAAAGGATLLVRAVVARRRAPIDR